MVQAIGYVRRSTNRQEESLEQQRQKLYSFAAARGWTLVKIYEDDAISGSDMHRPGLEALMVHAEQDKEIGIVLAWERNRLARPKDPVDGLLLERRLAQAGKRVFYVATGQEADRSFTSGLVGFVEHYQNGDYLRKLSRDAMRGMVSRAQRGFWPSGMVPFGYDRLCLGPDGAPRRIVRNMPDGTQLLLHPETSEIIEHVRDGYRYKKPAHETVSLIPSEPARVQAVAKVFADYFVGVPFRVLRDTLNAGGMRTTAGDIFTIATLHTILRNPAYKGTLHFNRRTKSKWHRFVGGPQAGRSVERHDEGSEWRAKDDWIVVENAWPALVDASTFDQVQAKLRQAQEQHIFATGRSVKTDYLLTGSLYCAVCGGKLFGESKTKRRKSVRTYRRYVCSTHHKGEHDKCPTRYHVPAEIVEERTLDYIKQDLQHLKGDPELQEYIQEELKKLCGNQVDARAGLQARLSDIDGQVAKLTTHLSVLDVQTATTLGLYAKAKALAEERQQVQGQLDAIRQTVPDMPDPREIAHRADEELANMDALLASGSLEEKRLLVRTYVKGMKVDPHKQEIEVSFLPALFSRIGIGDKVRGVFAKFFGGLFAGVLRFLRGLGGRLPSSGRKHEAAKGRRDTKRWGGHGLREIAGCWGEIAKLRGGIESAKCAKLAGFWGEIAKFGSKARSGEGVKIHEGELLKGRARADVRERECDRVGDFAWVPSPWSVPDPRWYYTLQFANVKRVGWGGDF